MLEDSAEGDIGCGVTSDGREQHTKSGNFARYKKFNGSRGQLQMHRLAADGEFEAASRLRCAIEWGSSAASSTVLGELTNKVAAKSVEAGAIRYSRQGQPRSSADNGASGSRVGALISAVGALKLGANGQGRPSGAIGKSDLKAPKFEKLATVLSGLFAQADLEEAIQALQQLKSKKKGGEQALVRRTKTRRPVRMGAQLGARLQPRAVLGRILRGRLTLNCGGQRKPRQQRKTKAPTLVESLKTSLEKATNGRMWSTSFPHIPLTAPVEYMPETPDIYLWPSGQPEDGQKFREGLGLFSALGWLSVLIFFILFSIFVSVFFSFHFLHFFILTSSYGRARVD